MVHVVMLRSLIDSSYIKWVYKVSTSWVGFERSLLVHMLHQFFLFHKTPYRKGHIFKVCLTHSRKENVKKWPPCLYISLKKHCCIYFMICMSNWSTCAICFSVFTLSKKKKILEPWCLVDCIDILVCGSTLWEIATEVEWERLIIVYYLHPLLSVNKNWNDKTAHLHIEGPNIFRPWYEHQFDFKGKNYVSHHLIGSHILGSPSFRLESLTSLNIHVIVLSVLFNVDSVHKVVITIKEGYW